MHTHDQMSKERGVIRTRNVDLMTLVEHAKNQIGDNKEIEITSQSDDELLTVKLKAW